MRAARALLAGSLLGVPLVVTGLGWMLPAPARETALLTLGVALEGVAIIRVGWTADAARRRHGLPALAALLGLNPQPTITAVLDARSQPATASFGGTSSPPPNDTARIASLERKVAKLRKELSDLASRAKEEAEAQRRATAAELGKISQQFKDAQPGIEEYWWCVLLAYGLILTNYQQGIASLWT